MYFEKLIEHVKSKRALGLLRVGKSQSAATLEINGAQAVAHDLQQSAVTIVVSSFV